MELKKRFLQFRQEDEAALRELQDLFAANADWIVDAFYAHLLKFTETRELLSREDIGNRLKGIQKQYLISLCSSNIDEAYHESRKRIGRTHDRIRLLPQFYLGMYSFYLSMLIPLIQKKYSDQPDKMQRALLALTKIINLDSQIAMEAYIESGREQLAAANQELATLNQDLEQKVDQRTQQLKEFEQKMRHSERLVLIGTLASEIAHEVGTPLNVISGRVELLMLRAKEDEKTHQDLQSITLQIDRITRIIRDLLDVSKTREGALMKVDLKELLKGVLEFLRVGLKKASITTSIEMHAESNFILGDRDQLQQVFLNLIMNSIQAMKQPGRLSIQSRLEIYKSGNFAVISIQDSGEGIPAEILEKVFDPFFTTKAAGQGTGLGLSIASDIVKKHGGRIIVHSKAGVGSTFEVWLPLTTE